MIGTLLAVGSGLASLYGSIKSAQANNNADQQLKQRQTDLDNWYNREYNKSYLDTSEARSTIQLLRNQVLERQKKVDQSNAIKGSSDEMAVATADAGQKNITNAITRLAGYGTQRKDALQRDYQARKWGLDNLVAANLQQKSQNWNSFMNNAMNMGAGAIEADGMGAFDKWDQKVGGWWKSLGKAKGVLV